MGNKYNMFFESGSNIKSFPDTLKEVQEHISNKFSSLLGQNLDEQKRQICSYIAKFLTDENIGVDNYTFDELVSRLYVEMAEFSFLTSYLYNPTVEEININSWNDVKITYTDGSIVSSKEQFNSPQHATDVIKRILHQSGMILDYSQPIVRGHLSNKIRITVFGNPITDTDKGVSASIRIVNPQKLGKDDFISKETATGEMLDFLSICVRYGVSLCVTGATGSGKTTLMAWLLTTIPDNKRLFTIENGCREFDLVKKDETGIVINNVIHTVTRYSEDIKQNIDQEKLLEFALTSNPDIICVGEMKSSEAYAAQEAARTGHGVITTTHANSCSATYNRMVTLCKMKYDIDDKTLYNLVTEAFPIVMFAKKLEDSTRKIMEITECEILEDGSRNIRTLYQFKIKENVEKDGKLKIIGEFKKVNNISIGLQKRLRENGMPLKSVENFIS